MWNFEKFNRNYSNSFDEPSERHKRKQENGRSSFNITIFTENEKKKTLINISCYIMHDVMRNEISILSTFINNLIMSVLSFKIEIIEK